VPCQPRPAPAKLRSWPTAERYGLIWVWTGDAPAHPLPSVPELGDDPGDFRVAGHFRKACHPNVMMINAIDAQHFNSVHRLPAELHMAPEVVSAHAIGFHNTIPPRSDTRFGRWLKNFYAGPITYSLRYWFGHTGCVTLGPDFLHFHIVFALRMADGGGTEGRTLLVTRQRSGPLGWALNRALLLLTDGVGRYFARGDTQVFQTIRFDFRTPIKADQAILSFIRHYDDQPCLRWGDWDAAS
jgi:phenylpropionate dioxygenase-like ring-hydroxylating dioxygenase large terminal subunit